VVQFQTEGRANPHLAKVLTAKSFKNVGVFFVCDLRLLLDNLSAHISKETQAWLSLHPQRFEFVFTPKHGSWLNIVETMFSKMARSMLRGIRVASKQELIERIHLYFDQINADPVIFRWKYKMDETSIG
jgi:hypothetical protein